MGQPHEQLPSQGEGAFTTLKAYLLSLLVPDIQDDESRPDEEEDTTGGAS